MRKLDCGIICAECRKNWRWTHLDASCDLNIDINSIYFAYISNIIPFANFIRVFYNINEALSCRSFV